MSWENYTKKSEARPLRPLYVKALEFILPSVGEPQVAVDLGCGAGTETHDLLQKGWKVHAYDKEPAAIEATRSLAQDAEHANLHLQCIEFEKISSLPNNHLVFSYHSLPFCDVDHFDRLIGEIAGSIAEGGFFVASFFGHNDDWVRAGHTLGSDVTEMQYHLSDFEILHLNEVDQLGGTLLNGPKRWHTIDVIAKKKLKE